jgi:hypothetical protein
MGSVCVIGVTLLNFFQGRRSSLASETIVRAEQICCQRLKLHPDRRVYYGAFAAR